MLIDFFISRNKRANGGGHSLKKRMSVSKPSVRVESKKKKR